VESLPSLIGEYFSTISGAIGEKFSNVLSTVFIFGMGVGVAIYESVVYAFISLAFFPVIFLTVGFFAKRLKKVSLDKIEASRRMGGVVEENLTAVKLIASFA
jgi:ABC-type multidrug transport system fused ATPase/permease subunit